MMFVDLCKDVQSYIAEFVGLPDLLNLARINPHWTQVCMPLLESAMERLNAVFPLTIDDYVNSQVSDLLSKIQGLSTFPIPLRGIEVMRKFISAAARKEPEPGDILFSVALREAEALLHGNEETAYVLCLYLVTHTAVLKMHVQLSTGVENSVLEHHLELMERNLNTCFLMFQDRYGREDFDVNHALDSLIAIRSIIEDGYVKIASEVIGEGKHLRALNENWSDFRKELSNHCSI